jgi:hypothetical protein
MTFVSLLVSTLALATNVTAPEAPAALPRYLEAPEQDVVKLVKDIEAQGWVGASEISLDSLRHPGDKVAYDRAIDVFAKRMQWAIYELSELKRNVIRYSVIVNQANLTSEKVALITDSSSAISQEHYFRAMWSLAGAVYDEQSVLDACVSEVCVIEVADAFEEMTRFAEAANRDLDFRKLSTSKELFWRFDRPILKASFSKTFRAMIPNNQDHNAYKVLAAGLVTPLSVAGVTTVDLLKAAGSAVFNPRYRHIKLEVDEVKMNYNRIREDQKGLFKTNYSATANGSRAAEYDKQHRSSDVTPTPTPGNTPSKPVTVPIVSEACSKMIQLAGVKYRAEMETYRGQLGRVGEQVGLVDLFAASLTPDQKKGIADYAAGYRALADSGKDAATITLNDEKMQEYLFYSLSPLVQLMIGRFQWDGCGNSYPMNDGYNATPRNSTPDVWARATDNCFASRRADSPTPGLTRAVFLNLSQGKTTFWACTSVDRVMSNDVHVRSCSRLDVLSGEKFGTTFGESLRDPAVRGKTTPERLSMTEDEFVRQEIPSCFTPAAN